MSTAIVPLLSVRRGKMAVEFYRAAFGAEVIFCIESDSGEVVARLSVDRAEFWVSDESPENANFSPETVGGGTCRIMLVVPDPDSVFDLAVDAGATSVVAPADEHGWRIGRVQDPFGHHWEICKEL